ncbi:hypothetical protein AT257_16230 [Bacillus cereus]|uniref:hypothetical protein n=1 Tax=Bacillus mycoides TaxID=1405 RepID=UPI00077B0B8C|nr:hypothetical protein [Bacillus mycoides]KXY44794.1 hypothetical protein AT257_16230 [Bacillus cereus]MCZ6940529.1 hypothetical protein [Bacillus mycoides]
MQLYQNEEIGSKKLGIILQPIGDMENVKRTILQAVHLEDLLGTLTDTQYEYLEKTFPSKHFLVWGINDKNITNERYHLIEKGFDVWFYHDYHYFLRAEVACSFHNPRVASELWPPAKDGRNFNNLYFCSVESLREINLSTSEINEALTGEAKKSILRQMTVYVDEQATGFLKLL